MIPLPSLTPFRPSPYSPEVRHYLALLNKWMSVNPRKRATDILHGTLYGGMFNPNYLSAFAERKLLGLPSLRRFMT